MPGGAAWPFSGPSPVWSSGLPSASDRRWMLLTMLAEQFHHWYTGVASSYFKNVKVKSVSGVDEVQGARSDCDGELVVQDLAVQLPLEQLWFPGLSQTC